MLKILKEKEKKNVQKKKEIDPNTYYNRNI